MKSNLSTPIISRALNQPELSKKNKVLEIEDFELQEQVQQLQRSPEWYEKRRGLFTGSRIKDLMTCDRKAAKKGWDDPEKIISLGETAKKYIFEKAMERKTGKVIQSAQTFEMKVGTESEPKIIEALKEKHGIEIDEVDFMEFLLGIAGASPDGILKDGSTGVETPRGCGIEMKLCFNWGTFYDRTGKPMDKSHTDFWQLQAEMLALNCDKMLYVVAEPSSSAMEIKIDGLQIIEVKADKDLQEAIKKRCLLGDNIIKLFLGGMNFNTAVKIGCEEFEKK